MAASTSSFDVAKNAERLAAYFWVDKSPQELSETLKQFLEPFSKEDRYRIINCKLERYNGRTVVHVAAHQGLHLCLGELLRKGGDPNRESSAADLKQTPLHISARQRRPKCFQILLQYGADINHQNQNKETPQQLAKGTPKIEKVIKAHFAKYEEPRRGQEDLKIIEKLHQLTEDQSPESIDEFKKLFGGLELFWQDLNTRFTDFEHVTLVSRICSNSNLPLLQYLVENTQSAELLHNLSDQKSPLHIATAAGNLAMARMLIAKWPQLMFQKESPEMSSRTPLHLACYECSKQMVDVFLLGIEAMLADYHEDIPLDLNVVDSAGHTPLHYACYNRHCGEIVHALLSFRSANSNFVNFDVNAVTFNKHRSVIHISVAREKSNSLVEVLLKQNGIDISLQALPSSNTVNCVSKLVQELAQKKGKFLSQALQEDDEGRPNTSSSLATPTEFSPVSPLSMSPTGYSGGGPGGEDVSSGPIYRRRTNVAELSKSIKKVTYRKRSKTEDDESSVNEFNIKPSLYISSKLGDLQIHCLGTEPAGYTLFSQEAMTPLTEACLMNNREIVETLLCAGAKADRTTVKLLQSLEQCDVLQLVLSYHTQRINYEQKKVLKHKNLQLASRGLKLSWNSLSLNKLIGEWFKDWYKYRPLTEKKDGRISSLYTSPTPHQVNHVFADTITEIDLAANNLSSVPIELFQLPHLKHLNLSNNQLEVLPLHSSGPMEYSGWQCMELTSLILSHNKFQEAPHLLWMLPRLEVLWMANNNLKSLGVIHSDHHHRLSPTLVEVNLSNNKLDYISDFLFLLPKIKDINLSSNSLHALPEVVWDCVSLEMLDVSRNQLSYLPLCESDESMRESNTTVDGVHKNNPITVPRSKIEGQHSAGASVEVPISNFTFSSFKKRTYTFLKRQTQSSGRHDMNESMKVQADDPSQLRVLKLSHNQLEDFPSALPCLAPHLQELDISYNNSKRNGAMVEIDVAYIPSRLKGLTATNCGLRRFGQVLDPSMRSYVGKTCRIPAQFGMGKSCIHRSHQHLEYLLRLNLRSNELERLPLLRRRPAGLESSIGEVGKIPSCEKEPARDPEEVACSSTKPDDLLYPNLISLDVSDNNLMGCLNPNIGFLTNLQNIAVSGNVGLTQLPKELAYLRRPGRQMKLNNFTYKNLPNLKFPPAQYQKKPLNQLLSYFRSALKECVSNRTIKLMVVGNERRGKTTLLRRLRRMTNDPNIDRTEGIDIHDWVYPDTKGKVRTFSWKAEEVTFLTWDFGGQEQYYVTHQCFYSKRSLYLVVFRLEDGENGVHELDSWLREIQIRAPFSPVIIVGTHLDKVTLERADRLLDMAMTKYSSKSDLYSNVIKSYAISSKSSWWQKNGMEELRETIYSVACHLFVTSKDERLEYVQERDTKDVSALFEQKVPLCYLELQKAIRKTVADFMKEEKAPVLLEKDFRDQFRSVIEEIEEMDEAVQYLTYQGTMLHYSDTSLQSVYFLDPQWLTKVMAAVIGPPKSQKDQDLIKDGVVNVLQLLELRGSHIPEHIRNQCVMLLTKFGVVLQIDSQKIMIPSLLPSTPPMSQQSDNSLNHKVLRRYWFSNYLSQGFWPRLICRLVADKLLRQQLIKLTPNSELDGVNDLLPWKPWRCGLMWVVDDRILLEVKEVENQDTLLTPDNSHKDVIPGKVRVEFHLHVGECERIRGALSTDDQESDPLLADASKVLVMFIQHLESLVEDWYQGIFSVKSKDNVIPSYAPCWRCVEGLPQLYIRKLFGLQEVVSFEGHPVFCFTTSVCVNAIENHGDSVNCPLHEEPVALKHIMPDLVFFDLYDETLNSLPENIDSSKEPLGFGGFGFVLQGTWGQLTVAFKFFLEQAEQRKNNFNVPQLLKEVEKQSKYQKIYDAIRKEVSFLAKLDHPRLTKLVGVITRPRVSMVLELAPRGSLRQLLKEYCKVGNPLQPLTMKECTRQIASGLQYLHDNSIAHLDLKSGNVLVWQFPSPNPPYRERLRTAGDVHLKLADYGISKISTYHGARLKGYQGTPGYAAPELVHSKGQEVDVKKGDVFSFGMTLSELMTFYPPFQNNREKVDVANIQSAIRNGERPQFTEKVLLSSSLLLQRLMIRCWDADPSSRPSMKEVLQDVNREEFHCLRTEVALKGLTATSASCAFRVEPVNPELSLTSEPPFKSLESSRRPSIPSKPLDKRTNVSFRPVGKFSATDQQPSGDYEDMSLSLEDSLTPTSYFHKPHTQVWVCGREFESSIPSECSERKGTYTILTFCDGELGYSWFSGSSQEQAEITSMCYASEHVWIGTAMGDVIIVDVFKHQTKVQYNLDAYNTKGSRNSSQSKQEGKKSMSGGRILNMLAIPEKSTVLISTESFKIWCCNDDVNMEELVINQVVDLKDQSPVDHMCKVVLPDGRVEVWGTCGQSKLVVLRYDSGSADDVMWRKTFLDCSFPNGLNLFCQYITCAHFVDNDGVIKDRVWVSTNRRSKLVCWDPQERKQLFGKEVRKDLEDGYGSNPITVRSLLASGRELFIGTSIGVVGVYNAATGDMLRRFNLHCGPVRSLLELPQQATPCICAEVPSEVMDGFGFHDDESNFDTLKSSVSSRLPSSYKDTPIGIHPLILSVGNGNTGPQSQEPCSPYRTWSPNEFLGKKGYKNNIFVQFWNRC